MKMVGEHSVKALQGWGLGVAQSLQKYYLFISLILSSL